MMADKSIPADPEEPLLTFAALAKRLAVSEGSVRADYKRGRLPKEAVIRRGRRIRFHPARIRAWIDSLPQN